MKQMHRFTYSLVLTCVFGCASASNSDEMQCLVDDTCDEPTCESPPCDNVPPSDAVTAPPVPTDAGLGADASEPDASVSNMICEPNSARCDHNANAVIRCDASGQSLTTTACLANELCDAGQCQTQGCTPDTTQCTGDDVYRCASEDGAFSYVFDTDCAAQNLACENGACLDAINASRGTVCTDIECLASRSVELVCGRYARDLSTTDQGPFSPGADRCDPGTLSTEGYAHALRVVNYGRWLAGLPEVNYNPQLNAGAQACATIMANQRALSHDPPQDWACYSPEGAASAGESNIHLSFGSGSIEGSVAGFFKDGGDNNRADVGHRRWLQSPTLGPVGYGFHHSSSANAAGSCYNVIGGAATSSHPMPFVSYPGPGPFPIEWVTSRFWALPWSVSIHTSYGAPFPDTQAWQVTVWRLDANGMTSLPVSYVNASSMWFGRTAAVVFTPDFEVTPGQYQIQVQGGEYTFEWQTELVRCQ